MNIPTKTTTAFEIRDLFGITITEAIEIVNLFYDQVAYVAEKSYRKKLADSIVAYCFDERDFHRNKMAECVESGDLERAQEHLSLMNYYQNYMLGLSADGELYYPESRDDVLYRLNVKNGDK